VDFFRKEAAISLRLEIARACIEIARERNSEFRATARKRSQQLAIDRMRVASRDEPPIPANIESK